MAISPFLADPRTFRRVGIVETLLNAFDADIIAEGVDQKYGDNAPTEAAFS
jgi:hypothetical protein